MIKTILALVEEAKRAEAFIASVATLARQLQAHVVFDIVTAAPLISPRLAPFGTLNPVPGERRQIRGEQERALRPLIPDDISSEVMSQIDDVDRVPTDVREATPLADLIMIAPPEDWEIEWLRRHVIETLLLSSGTALMLLPAGRAVRRVDHAVLGWRPDAHTVRALHELVALAEPGARIDVTYVKRDVADQPDVPLGRVAAMLARHGFGVETYMLKRGERVSERLSAFTLEQGADLLAVGGYGHTRARELVLGGVTRQLVLEPRLPILMVH
ncbi:MAG: universal stress protein [Candidatus Sphingomonas colombiensis]|nr:universal stress protein [Sphingomonas sp.]WEK43205.1 MAG: universal stress protein [Sphingomonas sp.]